MLGFYVRVPWMGKHLLHDCCKLSVSELLCLQVRLKVPGSLLGLCLQQQHMDRSVYISKEEIFCRPIKEHGGPAGAPGQLPL